MDLKRERENLAESLSNAVAEYLHDNNWKADESFEQHLFKMTTYKLVCTCTWIAEVGHNLSELPLI